MNLRHLLLMFLGIVLSDYASAIPDTVYFNEDWKLASDEDFRYFRILEVEEGLVTITDHYRNGMIEMIGTISNTEESLNLAKKSQKLEGYQIGEFSWFFENGWMYRSVNYTPSLDGLDEFLLSNVNPDSLRYEKQYFQNGDVKEEGWVTSDGLPHGTHIIYHNTGHKAIETTYNNGVVIRTKYTYSDNGVITSSTQYLDGLKNGEQQLFDYQGRLKATRIYDHDNLVKERKRYLAITRVR